MPTKSVGKRPKKQSKGLKISIGVKLAAGFLMLVMLLAFSSAWSYQSLATMQSDYGHLLNETYPAALAAKDLYAEILTESQLIMAFSVTRDAGAAASIKDSQQKADTYTETLRTAGSANPEIQALVDAITEKRSVFDRMVQSAVQNADSVDQYQLILQADNTRNMGNQVGKLVSELVTKLQIQVGAAQEASRQAARTAISVMVVLGMASALCGVLISILAYRSVARPLRDLATQLSSIAAGSGDLTRQLHVTTHDEIGMLGNSFNQLVAGLADMVRRVINASEEIYRRSNEMTEFMGGVAAANQEVAAAMNIVSEGSQEQNHSCQIAAHCLAELNSATEQIAMGAQHQASRVQETTITVHGMVTSMETIADTAAQMSSTSNQAAAQARQGAHIVDDTLAGMNRIRDRVMGAAERVKELGDYGGSIGEMLQVITDIAEQTNLLALNAAIEAARAGAQGRGFAVVAEEVRRLAERSAASVKEIRSLVMSIQVGTQQAIAAITETTQDVEQNVDLSNAAGKALDQILQAVVETTGGIQNIHQSIQGMLSSAREVSSSVQEMAAVTQENSAASEEMAAGAVQVSTAMDELTRISETNNRTVEQVASSVTRVTQTVEAIATSVEELTSIASTLRGLVGQFKV